MDGNQGIRHPVKRLQTAKPPTGIAHSRRPVARTGWLSTTIGEAFKRVDNGDVDSVAYFFQVFAADTDLSSG
ncbi:hypothetical protein AN915_26555 [Mycobacteroides immunogenum]|nr:hypothetical protein AN915_26555 [Mycobacteroides immunogenum]